MLTYGKRETPFKKQWRPFAFDFNRPAIFEGSPKRLGVSLEGLGDADTTNPIQVDHAPAVTMLHILIALIHSQTPL